MVLTWQEALADREARGEAREARKAVLRVVEHRWGSPPDGFVAALDAIDDLDRLHEIMERTLKATSLDDLELRS